MELLDPFEVADTSDTCADGADLLDRLSEAIAKYSVLPSVAHLHAVTLWIATTHALPAFDYAPRLIVRSAEKRSGKSRLLELVDATCYRPLRAVNATTAAIFRSLGGEHPPTLLLDEADTIFGSRKVAENNEDLRGLLNAGYQRGLPVIRTVGPKHEVEEFETFAMTALAGIGRMPDTLEDRAVVIVMRRRKPGERISPYRNRRDKPALAALANELSTWAHSVREELEDSEPPLPVEDRAADTWEPLVAVADAAGGHWPQRAREAALKLTGEAQAADTDGSINVQLLRDIQQIFQEALTSFMPSQELCTQLHRVDESPWKDWELTPSKLGHRLKEYGIRTSHNTDKSQRGYRVENFQDAFDRYLAPNRPDPRPKVSVPVQAAEYQRKVTDTFGGPDTFKASGGLKASATFPHDSNEKHLRTPLDTIPPTNGLTGTQIKPSKPSQPSKPSPKVYPNNAYCPGCSGLFGPAATKCPDCQSVLVPAGKEIAC